MKKSTLIWFLVAALLIIGLVWLIRTPEKSGQLDAFASCLSNSGAVFYGAFWCQHCQGQKTEFGRSAKFMPYVECSTSDGRGQLSVCTEAGINAYPTWTFADGTRELGRLPLSRLSEITGCELPE